MHLSFRHPTKQSYVFLFLASLIFGTLGFAKPSLHQTKTSQPEHTKTPQQFHLYGAAYVGALVQPSFFAQTDGFPQIQLDLVGTCRATQTCDRYRLGFLRTQVQMAFSNNPYEEDPRFLLQDGSSKEHHLPYFSLQLRALEMFPTKRLYVSFLNLDLSRGTRILDEALNAQVVAGLLSVSFGKRERGVFQGQCSFGMAGPGFKSVQYRSEAIPFSGLYLTGIHQSCGLSLGNQTVAWSLLYAIQSTLQIGQSGAGNPHQPGGFGALNSESRLTFETGLWVRAPKTFERAGILGFTLQMAAVLRYHLNRGCVSNLDEIRPACGNNSNGMEVRIPLWIGVLFGSGTSSSPAPTPSQNTQVGFYTNPWVTPSRGL